jgi:hypothetical protein
MTPDQFRALLLEIRDEANLDASTGAVAGEHGELRLDDARMVWHAAEIALAMLRPGRYIPKRAAQLEVRELLANAWPPDATETAHLN